MSFARPWQCCQTAAALPLALAADTASRPPFTVRSSDDAVGAVWVTPGVALPAKFVAMTRHTFIDELKRQVGAEIARLIADGNAHDMAARIGTDQPRISELRRGKLDRFSLETLIRYAYDLRSTTIIRFEPRAYPTRKPSPVAMRTNPEFHEHRGE